MTCTTNNTTKPDVVQRPSNFYGAPQGMSGRVFNEIDYGVQGIVLHCTDMTISQYVQYLACLSQPVSGVNTETNHHYSIGSAGALNQHIDDGNLSWTFGAYQAAIYIDPPAPTISVDWSVLQTANGINVSPDTYVINILIAKSYNQGTTCLTSTGLPKDQHEKIVQLLAYLSATYDIPLDADHINWHDHIATQACPSNECVCKDIACLLTDINTFCEEDCGQITYSEVNCDDVSHLLAIPSNCGNASGCLVSVPFDACCFGHLPTAGDIDFFVGLAAQDNADPCDDDTTLCLVKNTIKVTSPITGLGTTDSPLALDPCGFGEFIPDGTPLTLLGIDDAGCLVETNLADAITASETPITVVDSNSVNLTASGTNNHTLTADVKISATAGNQIAINPDGLFVDFTCTEIAALFSDDTIITLFGQNAAGDCASQDVNSLIEGAICDITLDDGTGVPLYFLGRGVDLTCPVFYTPNQLVAAGITVLDTPGIDLTLTEDNVLSAALTIDPAADNLAEVTVNGLYVPEMNVTVLDTCISATIVGNVLEVGINIDPDSNNILTCNPDGLFVQDLIPINTDCLDLDYDEATRELTAEILFAGMQDGVMNVAACIAGEGFFVPRGASLLANSPLIGDGSGPNPLDIDFSLIDNQDLCDLGGVIPQTLSLTSVVGLDDSGCLRQYTGEEFIAQFLEITNGNCITATLTQNVLNVEPVISPAIGGIDNVLSCVNTGLYVPRGAGIVPQNTNCIALQLVNGILTATPIIDPDLSNQLSCNVDGLYVEAGAGVVGGITDCIQVVATNGVISATPIISGAILGIDNVLSCEPGGLFVPAGAGLNGVSSDCITVDFNTATGDLTVTPIISPLTENILECTDTGLFVPQGSITAVGSTDCIEFDLTGGVLTATPIIDPDVDNLLECLDTGLFVNLGILDTACMDIRLNAGILSIEPIIDPAVSNLLTCGSNGLLAEFNSNIAEDTDCIELDVTNGILTANPILAPDQGALTNVLRCIAGEGLYVPVAAGLTVLDGSCVELQLVNGLLTAEVIIDPDIDNAITCGPDGLFVEICCPLVEDTNTVDLTLNDPRTITADVIIDPDPTNGLVVNANGLYVPEDFIQNILDTNCMDLDVTGGVLSVTPIISPLADNRLACQGDGLYVSGINVVDTNCIDLDFTADTLTANPIISAQPNNIIQCIGDGFFAEAPVRTVANTDCITLVLNNGELTVEPVIDPALDNTLQCGATGLFVPTPAVTAVNDTQCIDLDLTNGVLTASPIVDPAVDNLLACGAVGLYVPPMTGVDTNCIDIDITNNVITVNPILSATAGNALQCLGDGLFVQEITFDDTNSIDLTYNNGVVTADLIIDPDPTNALVVNATGVYVPEDFLQAVADTDCIDLEVVNGVLTASAIISPLADNRVVCQGDGLYVPGINVVDTNCIDLDFTADTLTANIIISAQANNIVQCLGDGMFAEAPIRTVADTNCISMVLNAGELTATPIIDPALDNQLSCGANGLYVPEPFIISVVDTDCLDLEVTAGTLTATVVIDPAADNQIVCNAAAGLYVPPITVIDTNCIDLDLTGNVLTANVIISAQANNIVDCIGDGLFAEAPIRTVANTDCITLTLNAGELTANPIIDPAADNQLVCGATGLYVPEPFITAINDTQCVTLDVTGGVLTATPILDPAADNELQCTINGLYVPPITVVDTNCIDLDLTSNVLTANPIISATADNQLECLGDGLYVPQGGGLVGLDTDCLSTTVTAGEVSVDPIIAGTQGGIANSLICVAGEGLYVPAGADLIVIDGNCIDLTITNGNVLQAEIVIDPVADNLVTCNLGAGLYVPPMTPIDTNCVTIDITNNLLTIDLILAPTQGLYDNITSCLADGLFTPETLFTRNVGTALSGANEIDVDTDGDGVADFTFCEGICEIITANNCVDGGIGADYALREFTLVGDTLTINSAPEHTTISSQVSNQTPWAAGGGGHIGTGSFANPSFVVHDQISLVVTNPSLCRNMEVVVTIASFFAMEDIDAGARIASASALYRDGVWTQDTTQGYFYQPWVQPTGAVNDREGRNMSITYRTTILPGASHTFRADLITTNWSVAGLGFNNSEWYHQMTAFGSTV